MNNLLAKSQKILYHMEGHVFLERKMFMVLNLNLYQTVAVAVVVFYTGNFLKKKVNFFKNTAYLHL